MNAQGEDVVAGVRTPQTIDQLAEVMPEAYQQFVDISSKLEYHSSISSGEVSRRTRMTLCPLSTHSTTSSAVKTIWPATNADTPKDARQAKNFGAEGVGLCRTEHVNFLLASSITISPQPETQQVPMPRATTAAWLVMPPRTVRMPRAKCMP